MMAESVEVILPLLRGEIVSAQTDWFTLDEARLQLRPFSRDGIEVVIGSRKQERAEEAAGRIATAVPDAKVEGLENEAAAQRELRRFYRLSQASKLAHIGAD